MGDFEGTEKKVAKALNIDGKYRIVSKIQSAIAKVTGGDNAAHGTVRKVDGSYEVWVDSKYSGKAYWTVVYYEMRHPLDVQGRRKGMLLPMKAMISSWRESFIGR